MALLQNEIVPPMIRPNPTNPTQDMTQNILTGGSKLYTDAGLQAKPGLYPTLPLLRRLAAGLQPRVASQIAFGNELEPGRQDAIRAVLAMLSPGTQRANAESIAAQARRGAAESASSAGFLARANGLGSGGQEGAMHDAFSQGNQAGNSYMSQMYSPEGQSQMLGMILQAISSGQGSQGLEQLLGINQALLSKPQNQQSGGGPFGALMGLAGAFAGGPGMAKLIK